MNITFEHLKTLYDLLAMQQAEMLTLSQIIQQRDSQIRVLQASQPPQAIPAATNGAARVATVQGVED